MHVWLPRMALDLKCRVGKISHYGVEHADASSFVEFFFTPSRTFLDLTFWLLPPLL